MQLVPRSPEALNTPGKSALHSQFLTFSLRGEVLAMEVRFVKEILQYGSITEVPLAPPTVRGVMNLRGAVIPVIDLAVRFGRPATAADKRTCVVILEVEEEDRTTVMGIVVDHVSEVLDISENEIEAAPSFGSTLRADFVRGVGKIGGRFVILLDIERVLSAEELGSFEFAQDRACVSEPAS